MVRRRPEATPSKDVLLRLLREVYRGPAWHGPSVRDSLRGVTAAQAQRRPAPGRNSIWELVLHLAYARHRMVIRIARLQAGEITRFPHRLRKAWWPLPPEKQDAPAWKADLALLDTYQDRLLNAIEAAPPTVLARHRAGSSRSLGQELAGNAIHDAYHAGQIRLLHLMLDA